MLHFIFLKIRRGIIFQWCLGVLTLVFVPGCGSVKEQSFSGTIEVDEVHVASRYGGRVEKIAFDEGDTIEASQTIVELDAREALARQQHAAAVLSELENGSRPEEIAAAKADMESLVAELEFARADEKRVIELFEKKAVSPTERDRAVSRTRALEKSVAAARSRYELAIAGPRSERIEQARAQLQQIEVQFEEMKIQAPSNCILEVLHVKVGDVLSPNQSVATLLLPDHLWVRVYVPEPWLGYVRIGQTVRARVDSFPKRDFKGVVEQIARAAEFTPRNVQTTEERVKQVFGVKVRLDNSEDLLRAGMAADVFLRQEIPKKSN